MAARKKRSRVWLERAVIAVLVLCIGAELVYWFRHRGVPGADVSAPEWVEQDILPLNPYSRPGTPLETIDGVVVHYVGNPGTSAAANRSFFANLAVTHETYASAHFVVGLEGEVLQCVPLSEIAYYDVTGKVCPKYYVDHPEAWEDFRSALGAVRTQENPS